MAKAYHIDLRERVVEYVKLGHSKIEASKTFNLGRNTVSRWIKLSKEDCLEYKAKERGFRKINEEALVEYVFNNNDLTLSEYAKIFNVNASSIHDALKKLKITRKKNHTLSRTKRRKARSVQKNP